MPWDIDEVGMGTYDIIDIGDISHIWRKCLRLNIRPGLLLVVLFIMVKVKVKQIFTFLTKNPKSDFFSAKQLFLHRSLSRSFSRATRSFSASSGKNNKANVFSLRTIHFYKKLPSSGIFSLTSNFVSASTLGSRTSEVTLQDEEEMFEMPHQELVAAGLERKAVIARPVIEPIDEEEDDEVSPGRWY